ncbi:MAG: GH92 family glycosyl hydrolase [Lacunisphaera sp.]|nr:GH92 family glycosyl hydrolase [Lacunisphaera sp.]
MKPTNTHPARSMLALGICAAGLLLPVAANAAGPTSLTGLVNPFIGTEPSPGSQFGIAFDTGNVFPGAVAPRGMLAWSPDTTTANRISGGYWYPDQAIEGFSLTHFSGRGVVCLKDIPFLPTIQAVTAAPGPNFKPFALAFSHENESAAPGYYRVRADNGIETELTVSPRAGLAQFSFPATSPATLMIRAGSSVRISGNEVSGYRHTAIGGGKRPYTIYFSARFEQPFQSVRTWQGNELGAATEASAQDCGAVLTFDPARHPTVRVRVAISYVSVENARANLAAEVPDWNFAAVRQQTDAAWHKELGRIQVEGGDAAHQTVFYTALYRTFIHPNVINDVNGQYTGMDEKVHTVAPGRVQYQNIPGWDQYRSHAPFMAMLTPKESSDVMQSLVNYAQQDAGVRPDGGGLPRWQQVNRNSGGMVGDGAPIIISSAHAFGATDFDTGAALVAMEKNATQPGTTSDGFAVRQGLQDYLNLGYVPDAVSVTLEYSLADYAIAQFARALGDEQKYSRYLRQARNWTSLFEPQRLMLWPRNADGSWHPELSEGAVTDMKQTFVEASAEQTLWMVNHNLHDLIERIGGRERAVARLDRFFTQLNAGMRSEFAYMGNEPCEGIPWIYNFAGAPAHGQKVIRRIQTELFTARPSGLPGNDDAGSLSSWYVLSALGFYPMIPGVGGLALSSPAFAKATIHLQNGAKLVIIGANASEENCYVQSLKVNGKQWKSSWLPWKEVAGGGTLEFTLGKEPSAWGTKADQLPPRFDAVQP